MLRHTDRGLFCEKGNFYIDPWAPVDFAVITHGHSDHARPGSKRNLTAEKGREILRARLGPEAVIETLPYGQSISHNAVAISFHPAGHILGSAQVRLEADGEIWVVSGDYKLENDGTCEPFEPVRCHTFITESTFALPIFHWRPQAEVFAEINRWWQDSRARACTSVLFCYALGKAQRILHGLDPSIGPIFLHGAMERFTIAYAQAGVKMPATSKADRENVRGAAGKGIVLAPGSAANSPWLRKFGGVSTASASGWMQLRGPRRRKSLDRGFVLSDHADWKGLQEAVKATGAENVWVTHGYAAAFSRYLNENGWKAEAIETPSTDESEGDSEGMSVEGKAPRALDSESEIS